MLYRHVWLVWCKSDLVQLKTQSCWAVLKGCGYLVHVESDVMKKHLRDVAACTLSSGDVACSAHYCGFIRALPVWKAGYVEYLIMAPLA